MFDVGLWEIILIFGIGLIILGPERLPRVAAQLGRWIGRAQRTANQFRRKLQRELELDDLMRDGLVPRKRPAAPAASKAAKTTQGSRAAAAGGASAGAGKKGAAPVGDAATADPTQANASASPPQPPPRGDPDPAPSEADRDAAPEPPPGATETGETPEAGT